MEYQNSLYISNLGIVILESDVSEFVSLDSIQLINRNKYFYLNDISPEFALIYFFL